ncbi:MAG TPA: glucan biosynthesis protein, partial [Opitutaceae bacterium]|nr:glucan biosynthesis protein [Opitutaceae bacterium]
MKLSSLTAPGFSGLLRWLRRPQCLAVALVLAGGLAAQARADDEMFDFEVLQYKAKLLAAKPYEVRPVRVPEHLLAPAFTYDEHRDIRFRPEMAWWRREKLPFQLQFFHPGFIYNKTVQLSEVDGRAATLIDFNKRLFDYGKNGLKGGVPHDMGFSGFRVHYALNNPNYLDELVVFQGASYFRALCAKAVYGLSARGLAIDTAEPTGEEFPIFEEFWIEKPAADAKSLTAYALLDSPSVAGAYRFIITPGDDTVMQVKLALYLRKPVKVLGVAPLTSMFWHGEGSSDHYGYFRPEVHDSD